MSYPDTALVEGERVLTHEHPHPKMLVLPVLAFFVIVAIDQVRAKRFHSALFWSVVLATSMVGTEISDFLNRGFGHASDDSARLVD